MTLRQDLKPLLWSYAFETLDAHRHMSLIIPAVLARGSWDQVEWLFATYPAAAIRDFVKTDLIGLRTLPEPALNLWSLFFFDTPVHRTAIALWSGGANGAFHLIPL